MSLLERIDKEGFIRSLYAAKVGNLQEVVMADIRGVGKKITYSEDNPISAEIDALSARAATISSGRPKTTRSANV